jgi:uncharacterized repeat protein (TIGR01451 family)
MTLLLAMLIRRVGLRRLVCSLGICGAAGVVGLVPTGELSLRAEGEGVVQIGASGEEMPSQPITGGAAPIQTVANLEDSVEPTAGPARNSEGAAVVHTHDPRVGPPGIPGCPPGGVPVIVGGPGVVAWDPMHYPDEYLCDGGDRGHPFHYEGRDLAGLETEDTIAESYDEQGKRHVVPSSRVCIYAPRFAAVRTISGSVVSQRVYQPAGAHDGIRSGGLGTHLAIEQEVQRDKLQDVRMRSRASMSEANLRDGGLLQSQQPVGHQNLQSPYQNLAFVTEGTFRQSDAAVLAYGVQAAGVWTRDQNPVVVAHDLRGHELKALFDPKEFVGVEDMRTPGELRVVKLADRDSAMPGDVVTFTLRVDNLGQRDILNVRIIDNLTPRLEYIAGSADSELAGGLDIADNGEGSSMLTFRLDEPLKGETGGAITFKCRVR